MDDSAGDLLRERADFPPATEPWLERVYKPEGSSCSERTLASVKLEALLFDKDSGGGPSSLLLSSSSEGRASFGPCYEGPGFSLRPFPATHDVAIERLTAAKSDLLVS
eukprot:4844816-Pleurochrysis_carterae.AAC.2